MTTTHYSGLLEVSERERDGQQALQNLKAINERNMNLQHQFEQILDGSNQLSHSKAQEICDQVEQEFGVKKDTLRAKASGLNWNKKVTSMVIFSLLLGFFGCYKILSTLDQQNQAMSQILMKMTKNQAKPNVFHQRTLEKVDQGAFDNGVELLAEGESPTLRNLTLEGFKGINTVDQQQDAMLEGILSKVVNLTRKFDNFTGLAPWEDYKAEVVSFESDILSDAQIQSLVNLLPEGAKLTKAYQASKDGWYRGTFHEKVDGKGPTLIVVKNGYGKIFGGYTDISWRFSNHGKQYGAGNSYQLFFQGNEAVKIPLRNPGTGAEISFSKDEYFSFYDGITVRYNCNKDYRSTAIFEGAEYEYPTGTSSTNIAGGLVVGSYNYRPIFQCLEIESWLVSQG